MEYTQITLDDWMSMKERLKKDLIGVQESFVRIGYTLRQIEEQELYKQDGYKSIAEFAGAEYGLSPSTVSRFISINKKYSIDGYSDQLRPEFAQLGSSKLSEMLALPDQDLEMIGPEATREGIRELKQFNRETPVEGTADDIRELIVKFFETNQETLNELFSSEAYTTGEVKKLVEIVNPSGNKTFKKGLYFLMMYEQEIKIKKFGMSPQSMTWAEFFSITREIFGEAAAGHKTWKNYFGGGEDDAEAPRESDAGDVEETHAKGIGEEGTREKAPSEEDPGNRSDNIEPIQSDDSRSERERDGKEHDTAGKESSQSSGEGTGAREAAEPEEERHSEEIAPAQKPAVILEKEQDNVAEHKEISSVDHADRTGEQDAEEAAVTQEEEIAPGCEVMNSPENIEKPFGSRKDFLDSLTAYGMAQELADMAMKIKTWKMMTETSFWEAWLNEEVDDRGRTIEEV
ncbi:hypothetical protein [Diplocloster hominis]|uniref:hypothetical protein n=1 Tax=Diplocloster hominis TaxID=3079010 RepID=UPI0031BBB8CF